MAQSREFILRILEGAADFLKRQNSNPIADPRGVVGIAQKLLKLRMVGIDLAGCRGGLRISYQVMRRARLPHSLLLSHRRR